MTSFSVNNWLLEKHVWRKCIHCKNSGKCRSIVSNQTKINEWKLQARFDWVCSWEIIKSATSLTTPSTCLSGIQFSTLKVLGVIDPKEPEKILQHWDEVNIVYFWIIYEMFQGSFYLRHHVIRYSFIFCRINSAVKENANNNSSRLTTCKFSQRHRRVEKGMLFFLIFFLHFSSLPMSWQDYSFLELALFGYIFSVVRWQKFAFGKWHPASAYVW